MYVSSVENPICHLEPMSPLGPGDPFSHDLFHMGHKMGKDHYIMYPSHDAEDLKYFILVDTRTGNRTKVVVH